MDIFLATGLNLNYLIKYLGQGIEYDREMLYNMLMTHEQEPRVKIYPRITSAVLTLSLALGGLNAVNTESDAVVPAIDATFDLENPIDSGVLDSPERIKPDIVAPEPQQIPTGVLQSIKADILSFNGCTANKVRNSAGAVLGIVGAQHCVFKPEVYPYGFTDTIYYGETYGSGPQQKVSPSQILSDPSGLDIFYIGTGGHSANEVRNQMIANYNLVNPDTIPINNPAIMVGYPSYNNHQGQKKVLQLAYGGIAGWPNGSNAFLATFGNWMDGDVSCTSRASGSGLWLNVPGWGPILVGVLAARAEDPPVTLNYSTDYGKELMGYLAKLLGVKNIDAEYMCGFATPISLGSFLSSVDVKSPTNQLTGTEDYSELFLDEGTQEIAVMSASSGPSTESRDMLRVDAILGTDPRSKYFNSLQNRSPSPWSFWVDTIPYYTRSNVQATIATRGVILTTG